jgi:hypothetical protein
VSRFIELFELNHDNFFVEFSISPIKEQYSFVERIQLFRAVKKISITLYPSNPNFAERWQSIDERMRRNNVTKYKETQENNRTGEHLVIDEETESKFLMSEDGYGVSSATGIDENGNENTITTEEGNKHISTNVNSSMESVSEILQYLQDTLASIIRRTLS